LAGLDRQTTEGGDLPASLEQVATEFGGFLERRVREIIEGAEARAAEIERDADRRARQREEQSELRARALFQDLHDHTKQVLDSLELARSALGGMVEELRAELDGPAAVEEPPAVEEPGPAGEHEKRDPLKAEQERLAALIHPAPANPEDQATSSTQAAEFDEMIEAEIMGMFKDGRSRQDAERFLRGFRLGDNYIGRLDEIYAQQHQGISERQGLRRRFRRGSR
jgi:hypothetical protein